MTRSLARQPAYVRPRGRPSIAVWLLRVRLLEREASAYAAQARWLDMFGKTLDNEPAIDAFDVAVRTRCFN